eukprot:scaffold4849_cov202-Prasinococcus_capsulatus_cf.AAC.5
MNAGRFASSLRARSTASPGPFAPSRAMPPSRDAELCALAPREDPPAAPPLRSSSSIAFLSCPRSSSSVSLTYRSTSSTVRSSRPSPRPANQSACVPTAASTGRLSAPCRLHIDSSQLPTCSSRYLRRSPHCASSSRFTTSSVSARDVRNTGCLRVALQPRPPPHHVHQRRALVDGQRPAHQRAQQAGLARLRLARRHQLHAVARLRALLVQRAHVPRRGLSAIVHHLARGRDQAGVVAEVQLLQVGQGADARGGARQATVLQPERTHGGLAGGAQEGVDERRRALVAQLRVVVEQQPLQVGQGADARGDARQATVPQREPLDGAVAGQGVNERRRALLAQRGVVGHGEPHQAGHRGQRLRQRARPARAHAVAV